MGISAHATLQPDVLSVDINALLNTLLDWYLSGSHNEAQKTAIQHVLASLVNKRASGQRLAHYHDECANRFHLVDIETFLHRVENELWTTRVVSPSSSTTERTDAIEAWIWVSLVESPCSPPLIRPNTDRSGSLGPEPRLRPAHDRSSLQSLRPGGAFC